MAEQGGASEAAERTEAATPRRLQRARAEGQVALSREVAPALLLAVMAGLVGMALTWLAGDVSGRMTILLAQADRIDALKAVRSAAVCVAWAALPVAALAATGSIVAVFGQTGGLLRLGALRPSLARLNPLHGFGRLFGGAPLAEAARAAMKLAMVGTAVWFALRDALPQSAAWLGWEPVFVLDHVRALALRLIMAVFGGQALLAGIDVVRARRAMGRSLRMSRQELRDEQRESDGDPQIKARIRRLRALRAKQRMMAAVPRATVVVTNPTHYAVALAYERGSAGAPRVVAKGIDAMAARIRDVAQQARVPMIANPALARALWRIDLDAEVPAELFQAVAEVIATVWRLRTPRARTGP